jgi:hypothetical protein
MRISMKRFLMVLAALAALSLSARPAEAQLGLGVGAVWGDDADFGVGGRLAFNLFSVPGSIVRIQALGAFDYFLDCDDCSYYEITPAAVVSLGLVGLGVYGGVGANIARLSVDEDVAGDDASDTDVGASLIIGARIPMGLFGEIRYTTGGAEQKVIAVGFRFGG